MGLQSYKRVLYSVSSEILGTERKAFDLTTKDEVEEMEERLQQLVDEALAGVTA